MSDYFGHKMYEFKLSGRQAMLVFPEEPSKGNPWLLKTEYFWAFPSLEIEMLKRGYFVAYIENETRWHKASDDDAKHELSKFLQKEFDLAPKCVPVGMSCGGMQAIYYAAKYPNDVLGLYLDAPVVNLLSCPAAVGKGEVSFMEEFTAHTGMDLTDLLSYRNHPLDNLAPIFANNIPIFLVCGDSDKTVCYEENGKLLYNMAVSAGINITQIVKENCDHHPHGLEDPSPLIDWTVSLYKE